jgi:hypothetical protein
MIDREARGRVGQLNAAASRLMAAAGSGILANAYTL